VKHRAASTVSSADLEKAKVKASFGFEGKHLEGGELHAGIKATSTRCPTMANPRNILDPYAIRAAVYSKDRREYVCGITIYRHPFVVNPFTEIVWPWADDEYKDKKLHAYLVLAALVYAKEELGENEIFVMFDNQIDDYFEEEYCLNDKLCKIAISMDGQDAERQITYMKKRFKLMRHMFENTFKLELIQKEVISGLGKKKSKLQSRAYRFDLKDFPLPKHIL